MIVRVHRRLQEMVDKPVALTDLYRFPTVRALTDHFSDDDDGGRSQSVRAGSERSRRRQELRERRVQAR